MTSSQRSMNHRYTHYFTVAEPHMGPKERYIYHSTTNGSLVESSRDHILEALLYSVRRVHKHYGAPNSSLDGRIYTGIGGVALMNEYLFRISPANSFSPGTDYISSSYKCLSDALEKSHSPLSTPRDAAHTALLDTSTGLATLILLFAAHQQLDPQNVVARAVPSCVGIMTSAVLCALMESSEGTTDDGCEVLYGRAGLLYALLRLREYSSGTSAVPDLQPLISDHTIGQVVEKIIQRGIAGSAAYSVELSASGQQERPPPLIWKWHGKRYLGGAHGVAGILQMILSCPENILAPHFEKIVDCIEWLIELQDDKGNWPNKVGYPTTMNNELVQWCHGAPAIIILFSKLIRISSNPKGSLKLSQKVYEKVFKSCLRGADLVYNKGLLRKGVGICHGIAGTVYALLAVSDAMESPQLKDKYLLQAIHMADIATGYESLTKQGEMSTPDHRWSLYEGVAGMCCAWAAVLRRLEGIGDAHNDTIAGMPGYADIAL